MNPLDQFDIVIKHGEHGLIAMVPQLNLCAVGSDLMHALAALEQKKQALSADLAKAGILPEVLNRAHERLRENEWSYAYPVAASLALFASKAVIVIVLLAVFTGLGADLAARAIRDDIHLGREFAAGYFKVGGHQFWMGIREELHRQASASADPPDVEKQQILSDIRIVVNRWQPFVREAMLVFAPPGRPSPQRPLETGVPEKP